MITDFCEVTWSSRKIGNKRKFEIGDDLDFEELDVKRSTKKSKKNSPKSKKKRLQDYQLYL